MPFDLASPRLFREGNEIVLMAGLAGTPQEVIRLSSNTSDFLTVNSGNFLLLNVNIVLTVDFSNGNPIPSGGQGRLIVGF